MEMLTPSPTNRAPVSHSPLLEAIDTGGLNKVQRRPYICISRNMQIDVPHTFLESGFLCVHDQYKRGLDVRTDERSLGGVPPCLMRARLTWAELRLNADVRRILFETIWLLL